MNPLSPKQIRSLIDMWADIHDEKEEEVVEVEQEVEVETTEEVVAEAPTADQVGSAVGGGARELQRGAINYGKKKAQQAVQAGQAVYDAGTKGGEALVKLPGQIQGKQDSTREYLGLPVADRPAIRKQQDADTRTFRGNVVRNVMDFAGGLAKGFTGNNDKPNTNPQPKVTPPTPTTTSTPAPTPAPTTGPRKVTYPTAQQTRMAADYRSGTQYGSAPAATPAPTPAPAPAATPAPRPAAAAPVAKPVVPTAPAVKPSVAIGNAARTGYNPRTSTNVMKYDKNLETKGGKSNRLAKALSGKMSDFKFKEGYDVVLDHLLSEGHADTVEEAHYIMLQMTPEHIQEIVKDA